MAVPSYSFILASRTGASVGFPTAAVSLCTLLPRRAGEPTQGGTRGCRRLGQLAPRSSDGRGLLDAVEADTGRGGGDGHGTSHAGADGVLVLPSVPPLPHRRSHLEVTQRGHLGTKSLQALSYGHCEGVICTPTCKKWWKLGCCAIFPCGETEAQKCLILTSGRCGKQILLLS